MGLSHYAAELDQWTEPHRGRRLWSPSSPIRPSLHGINVCVCVCVCVLAAQSCLTLCDSMDCRPPGSSVHGISQARILEWVAISFSRGLPNPWIEPQFPVLQAETLLSELLGKPIVVLIHSSFLGTRVEQNKTRESATE